MLLESADSWDLRCLLEGYALIERDGGPERAAGYKRKRTYSSTRVGATGWEGSGWQGHVLISAL